MTGADTIMSVGTLELDGKTVQTPSGAGHHLRGGATSDGAIWRLEDGRKLSEEPGDLRAFSLEDIRVR